MEDSAVVPARLAPVSGTERIEALDVVRGFALIGILMMNVEFFNRAINDLGQGIQPGLSGANYWVSFFVQYFVIGKFWTIFSLLFGMGFAVMLTRAERAGRSFLVPYIRRIIALALFGTLHHIFLWGGDILVSYAVGAVALLVVLYGRPKWVALAIALCVGLGFIPALNWAFGVAGGLAFFSLAAWWLLGDQHMRRFGRPLVIAFLLMAVGVIAFIAGAVMWMLPEAPREARVGLPIAGIALFTLGYLTHKFHDPVASRPWRLGVGIYCFGFCMMTGVGAAQYFLPEQPAATQSKAQVKRAQERSAQRLKTLKEHNERIAHETKVLSSGSYADGVSMRARELAEKAPNEVGFATLLIGMFLLGTWFVRAGVMDNTRARLPLFRKLAIYATPFGVGLGLLGSLVARHAVPGSNGADGWMLAQGLLMLGNLPASLGYVSLVILALHSSSALNRVRVLGPFGRMALTNYLTQSLIAATWFFGYGFGHWGASRVDQMLFVAVVVVLQIAFSHLWLSRFRYGPLEWLWRAVTYWTIPPLRIGGPQLAPAAATAA